MWHCLLHHDSDVCCIAEVHGAVAVGKSVLKRKFAVVKKGVVGAIKQWACYNCKDAHSVIPQGCHDSDMRFTHVCIGKLGRMHPAWMFAMSGIEELLCTFLPETHILGYPAHSLKTHLM